MVSTLSKLDLTTLTKMIVTKLMVAKSVRKKIETPDGTLG